MFRFPVKVPQTANPSALTVNSRTTAPLFSKAVLCTVDKQAVQDFVHLDDTVAKLILVRENYTPGFNLGGILIGERILLWAFQMFLWRRATTL